MLQICKCIHTCVVGATATLCSFLRQELIAQLKARNSADEKLVSSIETRRAS